jgi:hypothetical protein
MRVSKRRQEERKRAALVGLRSRNRLTNKKTDTEFAGNRETLMAVTTEHQQQGFR